MKIVKIKNFKTDEGKFSIWDFEKYPKGRAALFVIHEDKKGYIIRNAIIPEYLQKQGIATAFYIKANQLSIAKTGFPLRSTRPRLRDGKEVIELSDLGQKLWDSLVKKGYAIKLSNKNYKFS